MKKLICMLLSSFFILSAFCQNVQVKGNLKDNDGTPIAGANIVIKGTMRGTISDIDGNYTLDAPVGSLLVVNFIGYVPMEFEVTAEGNARFINKRPDVREQEIIPRVPQQKTVQEATVPAVIPDDTLKTAGHDPANGAAVMGPGMKYNIRNDGNRQIDYMVLKFKGIRSRKDGQVLLFGNPKPRYYYMPEIRYSSFFMTDHVNRLPALQNNYAQGRYDQGQQVWQGPESGELFAWGPSVGQIEYDGSAYDYDRNGRLVPSFTGNGQNANIYDPYDFFKRGMQLNNSVRIDHRIRRVVYYTAFKNNYQKGIVPLSTFNRNTFDAGLKYGFSKFKVQGDFSHSFVNSRHNGGSVLAYHTVKSVLLTPPTFDNSNGYGHDAIENKSAYTTSAGSQRSAATGVTDNPYWLMNNSTDNLDTHRTMGKLDLSTEPFRLLTANVIHTVRRDKTKNRL